MADNVEIQGLEFQIVNDSGDAVKGIDALRNSLARLKTACGNTSTSLSGTAKSIRELNNSLKNLNSGDFAQKITRMATALETLSRVSNTKISSTIAKQLTAINTAIAGIKWTDGDKLTALADGLRPFSELNRARLTSFSNQLEKLPAVIAELDKADLNKFADQLTKLAAAMKPFAAEMQKVSSGFSAFPSKIQRLITSTDRYNQSANQAASSTSKFGNNLKALNIAGLAIGLRRVVSYIARAVTESNSYQEDLNLFTAALGEYAETAGEYADTVSEILGIDPAQWLRNQGVFNTLLTGFGDTAERAQLMSKNLTQLGYDISSFFNISVEDAMQKLQSGISGELEPLRRLGYDLSQARLEQTALNLGIQESVSNMTQAEKAELRYYSILTQVTTAQGDMARTLEAPANQLRILQAQVTQTARAIGNIFIPVLNAVLPYCIAFFQVLREIANALASLMGFKLTEIDYDGVGISNAATSAGDLADNLTDATGAAKKLQKYLAGFDELNVMSATNGSGSSGSGANAGGVGGFDFDLPEYDFLGAAIANRIDEAQKKVREVLAEITTIVSGFALAVGALMVVTGANIPLGIGLMAAGAAAMGTAIGLNWNSMNDKVANTLALILGMVGGATLALGAILAFSGANLPLGIALMAVGAVSLGTAAAVNWHASEQNLTDAITSLTGILSGAALAVGALLAFTGAATGLGIALMVIGASSLAGSCALNWNSLPNEIEDPLSRIGALVSTAMLALGAIIAFSGGGLPLGIGLMVAGATGLASAISLNWNGVSDEVKNVIAKITSAVAVSFLAVGAILAFTAANIPLGLGLMVAGAAMMGTAIAPNWQTLSATTQKTILTITAILGGSLLGIGGILAFSGVNIPLGLALMAAGALSLGTAASLDWNSVKTSVAKAISVIAGILGGSLTVLGVLLCLSGAGIGLGLAVLAAGLSLSHAAWSLNSNPITNFVRTLANSVIGILNRVIDGINSMFHISFKGLKVLGKEVIPAFDTRLINLRHISMFAEGGFPNEGQLFIAREAGAEMVGSIGRKTAVANNDQIVESVSSGVYRAVRDAMNNQNGSNRPINVVAQCDGKNLFRIVVDQNGRVKRSTGRSPLAD